MDFWSRVAVQVGTPMQSMTGAELLTWADVVGLEAVEARLLPLTVDERKETWATPEEDAYEVHIRGSQPGIRPKMRVVVDSAVYDIRRIVQPPPFGDPTTVLKTVLVTP